MLSNDIKKFIQLLLLASCFSPSFLFIKIAIEHVQPFTLTCLRLGIGAFLLLIILQIKRIKLPKISQVWNKLSIAALFQCAIPFTLFSIGEQYVSSSIAAIVNGTTPLLTLIVAHIFTENDRLTKAKTFGASIGLFGLFILISPSLFSSKIGNFYGIIALIFASTSYAIAFVYIKKNINISSYPPLTVPTIQLSFSFLFLLPFALIFETPSHVLNAPNSALTSIFGLGFFGGALAFLLFYKMLETTSATYISMINYITPVFGVALGMAFLKEDLTWNAYLGCMLILVGVMIANGLLRLPKKKQKNPIKIVGG